MDKISNNENLILNNSVDKNSVDNLSQIRGYYIKDFINYISIEENLSSRTVKVYAYDLKIFFDYLKPFLDRELTLESIDERTLREFLTYLKLEKNYTPKALNRKIATLNWGNIFPKC
ncbi:MAG: site-specific integrase [Armatimonadetes bacterium]|nr:site-specific integrase [Armatimonadota bacterium]